MLKKTISSQIIALLKKNSCWLSGQQLELRIYGHKGSSISRIARMLANEGKLLRRYVPVKGRRDCVEYHLPKK